LPETLAEKLAVLADLGIRGLDGSLLDDLRKRLVDERRARLGYEPSDIRFEELFAILTWEERSPDVMMFDFECIDDPKAYSGILYRLNDLFRGSLGLTNVDSLVDWDAQTAWASCDAGGKAYRVDLRWKDDWADSKIIDFVADIAKERGIERRPAYLDCGGQNITLFALTEAELSEMRRQTGLDVNWIWEIPAHLKAILRSLETERGTER
jgi:hypothetical protein